MQPTHYNSILPEIFRHKTSKVRVLQPKNILVDFHGTISERKWEDKVVFPYVRRALASFVREHIYSDQVQKCLPGLKNESWEQRFRYKCDDAPVIDDLVEAIDLSDVANQVSDFLLWQIKMRKETKETEVIQRLVWLDGFKRKQIATPLYEDVFPCVRQWREQNNCKIHIICSIEPETLKLLMENTTKGNLGQFVDSYVGARQLGDKLQPETYKAFYEKCCCSSAASGRTEGSSTSGRAAMRGPAQAKPRSAGSAANGPPKSARGSPGSSLSSLSSEIQPKPVLFLTDSGQAARAAGQVAGGAAFECLLVNRPGNKRIRTYYLSQFAYIDRFDDIEFVN